MTTPPEVPVDPQPLCASGALVERGDGVVFDVLQYRQPARAFALRWGGRVVAYLNRCAHVPVEMDWQPGKFLDPSGEYILCSVHGAAYLPATGGCFAGPCGRGRLTPIETIEKDGHVYWLPSRDTRPVPGNETAPS